MRVAPRILAALALATLAAAGQDSRPEPARAGRRHRLVGIDVHVLELVKDAGAFVPTLRMVTSKRLLGDAAENERALSISAGGVRFVVEARPNGDGAVHVDRSMGRSRTNETPSARTVQLSDLTRWGRVARHGSSVRAAMLCEPVTAASAPFAPIDPRGFLHRLVDVVFQEEHQPKDRNRLRMGMLNFLGLLPPPPVEIDEMPAFFREWTSPRGMACQVLGSVPLWDWLDPADAERILTAAALAPPDLDSLTLRPLIALGDVATLERLAKRRPTPDERTPESDSVQPAELSSRFEDAVLVAYASARDPESRGLAGWVAAGMRAAFVYDVLLDDVRAGRTVLPGDESLRGQEAEYLVHARAWLSVGAPLLTLGACAAAIAAVMLLLRKALRRAL